MTSPHSLPLPQPVPSEPSKPEVTQTPAMPPGGSPPAAGAFHLRMLGEGMHFKTRLTEREGVVLRNEGSTAGVVVLLGPSPKYSFWSHDQEVTLSPGVLVDVQE